MPTREIQSKDNVRLKELRRAFSLSRHHERDLVGIEGPKMLEEALRTRLRVATLFVAQGSEPLLETLRLPRETEILRIPRRLLESALATETPQPIAALVEPPQWSWEEILGHDQEETLILVLAGLQDPGNLGTILRSAEAFGATGIVSLPGTVSAWNPKAVRASAGSVFRVPVVTASEKTCFDQLRDAGVRSLATTAHGAQPADRVDLAGPVALLIGNEGNGIPDGLLAKVGGSITIPCPGPVESLNAAIAASVMLYEVSRQRNTTTGAAAAHPTRHPARRSAR